MLKTSSTSSKTNLTLKSYSNRELVHTEKMNNGFELKDVLGYKRKKDMPRIPDKFNVSDLRSDQYNI